MIPTMQGYVTVATGGTTTVMTGGNINNWNGNWWVNTPDTTIVPNTGVVTITNPYTYIWPQQPQQPVEEIDRRSWGYPYQGLPTIEDREKERLADRVKQLENLVRELTGLKAEAPEEPAEESPTYSRKFRNLEA